jgi:hypothetical protein
MNTVSTTFRKFYQQAKGIPFFRFDLSEVEHAALAEQQTDNQCCCFNHLISLPIDKNYNYRNLYDYQAYVATMLDVTFASPGSFNVRVEKIKDTNEMVQSGLTVVPEFPVGIASIVTTFVIAAIIIAAKRMSFLHMGKVY